MFTSRVAMRLLADRLDAEHFEPSLLRSERMVIESGLRASSLDGVRDTEAGITYGIVQPGDFVQPGHGVRMIRCTDLGGLSVDMDSVLWVDREIDRPYGRSRVQPGDVLVGIAGSVGMVGIAPAGVEPANLNQSVARVRCRSSALGGWTAAYLASRYGQDVLARRSVGAVQQHLNLADLPSVPVPEPDAGVVSYVAAKVQQAEALRVWARTTEAAFRAAVGIEVPDSTGRGRQSRVPPADLDADLNPGRFTPDRLEVRRALTRNGARLVESFATIAAENTASPAARSRYLGLDGISSTSIDVTLQSIESAEVSGTCRVLPRGAAISKLRPYLNKAVFVPGGMGPIVGSTELLCVRSDSVHPGFVYGVLKLDTTVRQLNPVASGATHPRVGADEALDLLVPWHDDHERLGRSLERAQQAYFGARSLVTAARLLVEALIERKVTEAELIAAGRDPGTDRALLSRLHDDGLNGTGEPLFPDLDALAELLAEAASTR
jgi:type I restriction enzyme S subunit